jgi:hypothetical protein
VDNQSACNHTRFIAVSSAVPTAQEHTIAIIEAGLEDPRVLDLGTCIQFAGWLTILLVPPFPLDLAKLKGARPSFVHCEGKTMNCLPVVQ